MEEKNRLPDQDDSNKDVEKLETTARKLLIRKRVVIVIMSIVALLAIVVVVWIYFASSHSQPQVSDSHDSQVHEPNTVTEHEWEHTTDPKEIPIGDGKVSSAPKVGYVYSCNTNFRQAANPHTGPWVDIKDGTWNSQTKAIVRGEEYWPMAEYKESANSQTRTLVFNGLPVKDPTGIFPIAKNDPAYQYDTNPNAISAHDKTYNLALEPQAATEPNCLPLGAIGVFSNGVLLFNALDDAGLDAVAHEAQDACDGHPSGQEQYHYHNAAKCIADTSANTSTLIGYALDGFGIFVERDKIGNLPTNADLDECHGRTSEIIWNGKLKSMYHYSATLEYPYTVGCFHGTPVIDRPAHGNNPR